MALDKDTRELIALDLALLTAAEFNQFRDYLDAPDVEEQIRRKRFFGPSREHAVNLLKSARRRYQTIQKLRLPDGHNKLVWQIERLETLVAELSKEASA